MAYPGPPGGGYPPAPAYGMKIFEIDKNSMISLLSGGAAGTAVDVALFPIDTLKTRLQSKEGFIKSGGFRRIYSGLGPTALGSAPNAALFFLTYDTLNNAFLPITPVKYHYLVNMTASSISELVACLIRVPVEILKQRKQTYAKDMSALSVARKAILTEGFINGLYRGFGSTLFRDIPFTVIQFGLWEYFKAEWRRYYNITSLSIGPLPTSICGAFAGGISAAVTTPLDVIKTRIMLAKHNERKNISTVLKQIYRQQGIKGLYAGVIPRTIHISFGGFIYFGAYQLAKDILSS